MTTVNFYPAMDISWWRYMNMAEFASAFFEAIEQGSDLSHNSSSWQFEYLDDVLMFEGRNLQYYIHNNEVWGLTGGVINRVTVTLEDGRTVFEAKDLNISAATISELVAEAMEYPSSRNVAAVFNAMFKGNDRINGASGRDKLLGFSGDDSINGGAGNDIIDGGSDEDQLIGGIGRDVMTGGTAVDTFVFSHVNQSSTTNNTCDVITDFVHGVDKINLRAIDAFSGTTSTNDNFKWNTGPSFSNTSQGEVRFKQFNNDGTGNDYTMIYIDTDGDVGAEMLIRLTGLHNLTASDFIL